MDILQPRRILTALAIVVTLAATTVAAAGIGSTSHANAGPLPVTFVMAEARIGDQGNYTWSHVVLDADGNATVVEEHELWGFRWLAAKPMRDKDGRLHDTNTLHQWGWQRCDDCGTGSGKDGSSGVGNGASGGLGWERYAEPVYSIDRSDLSIVAYSYLSESAMDPNQDYGGHSMRQSMLLGPDDRFAPNCGPLGPWQGKSVPLGDKVRLFSACFGFGNAFSSDGTGRFEAQGTQVVENRTLVLFSQGGWQDTHVWYDASIPVPLRIAVQRAGASNEYDVLQLTNFLRGSAPLAWGGDSPLAPAPTWVEAPLVDGLADETGVEHPFGAHDALQAARGQPEAEEFFAVLDRGYVSFLDYREHHREGATSFSWDIAASDGKANPAIQVTMDVVSEERSTMPSAPVPLPPLPGFAQTVHNVTITVEATSDRGGSHHPDPSQVPATAPTVASMMTRWQAFASAEHNQRTGNAWGLRIICVNACDDVVVERWAGHSASYSWANGTSMSLESLLTESASPRRGHDATLRESTYLWQAAGAAPSAGRMPAPAASDVQLSSAWVWIAPNAYVVAGTGAFAVLAGLAYLLWPILKSGALVGLFSRVQSNQVLEHPVRRDLLHLVEANPGIHLRELQRRLKISNSQLDHHVRKLADASTLRLVRGPGYTCLFARNADAGVLAGAGTLKAPAARRILQAAQARPGIGVRELAREAGLSTGTVSHHVERMRAAGLLQAGTVGLVVTEKGQAAWAA